MYIYTIMWRNEFILLEIYDTDKVLIQKRFNNCLLSHILAPQKYIFNNYQHLTTYTNLIILIKKRHYLLSNSIIQRKCLISHYLNSAYV